MALRKHNILSHKPTKKKGAASNISKARGAGTRSQKSRSDFDMQSELSGRTVKEKKRDGHNKPIMTVINEEEDYWS